MKKIALVLILAFVGVSLGSLMMGLEMDYHSEVFFNSILFLLVCIALEVPKVLQNIWIQLLDFIDLNNRNYKKSLLDMDDVQFSEERDIILDSKNKDTKKLFDIYEEIKIQRIEAKKTQNV